MRNKIFLPLLSSVSVALMLSGCMGDRSENDYQAPIDNQNKQDKKSDDKSKISDKINSAPEGTFKELTTNSGVTYSGELTATDSDGDTLIYEIVKKPLHGEIVIDKNGCFTYKPEAGYIGEDSFSYIVKDEISKSKIINVTIHISDDKDITKPLAPSSVDVEAITLCKLKISYQDNSDNENGFEIYKDGELISVESANTTITNICSPMKPSKTYTIGVKSRTSAGSSDMATTTVTAPEVSWAPDAPSLLKAESISEDSIRLSWQDNSDHEEAFDIYQDSKWIKSLRTDTTSTIISDLKAGTTYTFMIESRNKIGANDGIILRVKTKGEKVIADKIKPVITILGKNPTTIKQNDEFIDKGILAIDDRDGDITSDVEVTSDVDSSEIGDYKVIYSVSDKAGNISKVTRDVKVVQDTQDAPDVISSLENIQALIKGSKDATISDVTFIAVGDSIRSDDELFKNGEIYKTLSSKLKEYDVATQLQAQSGHTIKWWGQDTPPTKDSDNNAITWKNYKDTINLIPNDGSTTIISFSLGINDARYFDKDEIKNDLKIAYDKIVAAKPNVTFLLTMPHKMVGLDKESKSVITAYEEFAKEQNLPLLNVAKDLFNSKEDLSLYRDADSVEYGSNVRIHLSSKGQTLISSYILSKILPKD